VFFGLKHIQTIVLVMLFLNGSDNINNLESLGFMLFFVIYTTYEQLYRRTSKVLTIFVASFIFGQYWFSLQYHHFKDDPIRMRTFKWFDFYREEAKPNWEQGSSIYFRHSPYPFNVLVMILMSMLATINSLFSDEKVVKDLTRRCYEGLRNDYSDSIYVYTRIKNGLAKVLIYFALAALIYFLGKVQTNAITSALFLLNIVNLAWFAKGDSKLSTIKHQLWTTQLIKGFSSFILTVEIMFIVFIGELEKPDQPNSLD
jgi:hypothetical protein